MIKLTLCDITDGFFEVHELAEELGDEDPEVKAKLDELMAELMNKFHEKADTYASVIGDAKAKAEAQKAEAKRIQDLAKQNERKAARLKNMLQEAMQQLGLTKAETDYHKFSVGKVGGKQRLELDVEPDELPESFRVAQYKADTDAIRQAIEEGQQFEFARLAERSTTLRIK